MLPWSIVGRAHDEEGCVTAAAAVGSARGTIVLRWAPFAVLVAGWLVLYPAVGDYANPDGVAYTALAEHWRHGRWAAAVSGYWSPLLPWLLAPLLAVGVAPLLAIRVLLRGGALLTLVLLRRLALLAGVSVPVADAMRLVAAPVLVWASLFGPVPRTAARPRPARLVRGGPWPGFADAGRPGWPGMQAGALAAVAYLAKAYSLPFLAVHGLYAPPHPESTSVWEDPRDLPVSQGDWQRQWRCRGRHCGAPGERRRSDAVVLGSLARRAAPLVLLAAVTAVAVLRGVFDRRHALLLGGLVVASAIYLGGLVLIIAIERYLWSPVIALVVLAAAAVDLLASRRVQVAAMAAAGVLVAAGCLHALLPRWGADREVAVAVAERLAPLAAPVPAPGLSFPRPDR